MVNYTMYMIKACPQCNSVKLLLKSQVWGLADVTLLGHAGHQYLYNGEMHETAICEECGLQIEVRGVVHNAG